MRYLKQKTVNIIPTAPLYPPPPYLSTHSSNPLSIAFPLRGEC